MTGSTVGGMRLSHSVSTNGLLAAASDAIRKAAIDALLSAADEIVKPVAVEKAPFLVNTERAGTGHGPRADTSKYQGGKPGELRESAHLVDERDTEKRVGIVFDTPYASLQHERMDWHHADGEAKYLENALNETSRQVIDHIAERIREVTA